MSVIYVELYRCICVIVRRIEHLEMFSHLLIINGNEKKKFIKKFTSVNEFL